MPDDLHPLTDPSPPSAAGSWLVTAEPTVEAYRHDLRCYWTWGVQHGLQPLQAQRGHLELDLRDLQSKGYVTATTSRRLSTVAACSHVSSTWSCGPMPTAWAGSRSC